MIKVRIPSRFRVNVILSRMANGSYVNGLWQDGLEQQTPISVSWQALTSGDYRLLPEGESPSGVYVAYWNKSFSYGLDGSQRSDQIIKDGIRYKLITFDDWTDGGYSKGLFRELKP